MPTVSQFLKQKKLVRQLRRSAVPLSLVGLFAAAYPAPVLAQLEASLTEKHNIVKVSSNGVVFADAITKQALGRGNTIVTGARSRAGVTFSDKSVLRINESSRVVVTTGTRQRDANFPNTGSRVFGNFNGPGRFRGKNALCAVRGTKVEMDVKEDKDVVRCFDGEAIVAGNGVRLITGRVTRGGALNILSEDLANSNENWEGAKFIFLSGVNKDQNRLVSQFNPQNGTVVFNAAFGQAAQVGDFFMIITPNDARYVMLTKNTETYVPNSIGATPVEPYPTEPLEWAGGSEMNYIHAPMVGNQQTYRNGFFFERSRMDRYYLETSQKASQGFGTDAPGIQVFHPRGSGTDNGGDGNLNVGLGNNSTPGTGNLGLGVGNPNPNETGDLIVEIGPGGTGQGGQPGGGRAAFVVPRPPQIGGFGFTTRGSDAYAVYARAGAAIPGGLFFRTGGRIGNIDRRTESEIDELLLRYRSKGFGDVQVGRFRWFAGPSSNSNLGSFLSFTTVDGILWQAPPIGSGTLQLAWLDKINPLSGPRVGGYAARFTTSIGTGYLGFSLLTTAQKTVGGAADFAYQIIPQRLEVYGEWGVDTAHQTVYSIGLYFPELFQSNKIDLSAEFSHRGGFGNGFDLTLYYPVGRKLYLLGSLSKLGARSWTPGAGVQLRF